jgi:hypothetical protein
MSRTEDRALKLLDEIYDLCLYGFTLAEIARMYGFSIPFLSQWLKTFPSV